MIEPAALVDISGDIAGERLTVHCSHSGKMGDSI